MLNLSKIDNPHVTSLLTLSYKIFLNYFLGYIYFSATIQNLQILQMVIVLIFVYDDVSLILFLHQVKRFGNKYD